ncbi:prepilin peptidase [Candidatus Uhrbacteria bacterium]|nr:prepilin peptidase [Candidatus Uhrbacteria bacterium]
MFEYVIIFILGTIIGSFLNAVIWRIHASQSVVRGRSKCVRCTHELSPGDLIPIVSFVLLGGRCRYCKKAISWQYPLVEFGMGILFVLSYAHFFGSVSGGIVQALLLGSDMGAIAALVRVLVFFAVLTVLFVYDARWGLVPDSVTLPAIPIALLINLFVFSSPWVSLLVAGLVGGGFFTLQYVVSKGVWIGGGDIRLGALMGVMLGFPEILYALFIAYSVGACVAIVLLSLKKKGMKSEMPFGPFLCGATAIMLLYGEQIINFAHRFFLY